MDRNSNKYTFIFAIVMVFVVAASLSIAATTLQPMQDENVRQEKMQNILATIGIECTRLEAEKLYNKHIVEEIALNNDGEKVKSVKAFNVSLSKQMDKPIDEQVFPMYKAQYKGTTNFVIPLRGKGLWDAIWGYVALEEDFNTVQGVIFDHKGETAGLGAEITKDWFQENFRNEKIFNDQDKLVGIKVTKGYSQPENKDDNKVDAISGATITGNGVTDMMQERLKNYLPYIKSKSKKIAFNDEQ